jgi:hypothetical protein
MGILRRIISIIVLTIGLAAVVGACLCYEWNGFANVFKNFDFGDFVIELMAFFSAISNALILFTVGLIGATMPTRK